MKSGFKMRSGNDSSFKMMGSSPAKDKTEKTKKPTKPRKSTVAVDGSLKDAESDYKRDLKNTSNNLTKKPVGPVAEKKKVKEEEPKVPTNYDGKGFDTRKINPGFEDPLKIQKLQRKGLTPDSQKFSEKAKENEKNAK